MVRRATVGMLWLGLLVVMATRPPDRPDLVDMLLDLMLGRFGDYQPLVAALFWSLGVWPAAWLVALRRRLTGWPPAWPFVGGSFLLGGYALLPWFALSQWHDPDAEGPSWLQHPAIPAVLCGAALLLGGWAVLQGDPRALWVELRIDGFTFAMIFDFTALWLTSVVWAHAHRDRAPWALALVPLAGFCAWLSLASARSAPDA